MRLAVSNAILTGSVEPLILASPIQVQPTFPPAEGPTAVAIIMYSEKWERIYIIVEKRVTVTSDKRESEAEETGGRYDNRYIVLGAGNSTTSLTRGTRGRLIGPGKSGLAWLGLVGWLSEYTFVQNEEWPFNKVLIDKTDRIHNGVFGDLYTL
jgi:hypothetical protein